MTGKEWYAEQCRRPEWQKKRLEIMNRDGFQCQGCGEKQKTLHIHHRYYAKGRMPWEYPSESLITMCQECHADIGDGASKLLDLLFQKFGYRSVLYLQGVLEDMPQNISYRIEGDLRFSSALYTLVDWVSPNQCEQEAWVENKLIDAKKQFEADFWSTNK